MKQLLLVHDYGLIDDRGRSIMKEELIQQYKKLSGDQLKAEFKTDGLYVPQTTKSYNLNRLAEKLVSHRLDRGLRPSDTTVLRQIESDKNERNAN